MSKLLYIILTFHKTLNVNMNCRIKLLNTKRRLLYLKTQFVPRSKHFSSVIKPYQFMLYPLNTKRRLLYLKTQFVPRSKHFHLL